MGPQFTWSNNREENRNIHERLDLAFATDQWIDCFGRGRVNHLVSNCSDHLPIELIFERKGSQLLRGKSGFHFEAFWLSASDLPDVIESCWVRSHGGITDKLSSMAGDLQRWNKEAFGNIRRKLVKLWQRLIVLCGMPQSTAVLSETTSVKEEISATLRQE